MELVKLIDEHEFIHLFKNEGGRNFAKELGGEDGLLAIFDYLSKSSTSEIKIINPLEITFEFEYYKTEAELKEDFPSEGYLTTSGKVVITTKQGSFLVTNS